MAKKIRFAAWRWQPRVSSSILRLIYFCLMFAWPVLAGIIAFRAKEKRLARWDSLMNQLRFFLSEPWSHGARVAEPLDCTDFLVPLLYIYGRTGYRIPDQKDETAVHCRRLGIPTPRILGADDVITPGKIYIVKPVDGCRAAGIHFTDQPQAYFGRTDLIVQEVARNPLSLRRLWGTNTLASFRFITAIREDGHYEVVACILRVPIGDSAFDNTCKGNGYAAVNSHGVLQRLFMDKGPREGYSRHLSTGEIFEGIVIDGYADCAALAVTVHHGLAPGMPILNADIALTDQGPMLIEINRAPGQYEQMYCDGYSEKCVQSICRMVGLVHSDVAQWLRLSNRTVEDDFSRKPDPRYGWPSNRNDSRIAERTPPVDDRKSDVEVASPV
jgi:hypothetical protein